MREPDRTQHVTLRVKKSVLDHFKAGGKKGYQTRINAVLESYCASTGKKPR
ncbi:MAG: BrnA antitoxin family protein [Proteobacteria bacterium]|nr:BrnA antitoxin family protein [Pseudomonadota bacterium]